MILNSIKNSKASNRHKLWLKKIKNRVEKEQLHSKKTIFAFRKF